MGAALRRLGAVVCLGAALAASACGSADESKQSDASGPASSPDVLAGLPDASPFVTGAAADAGETAKLAATPAARSFAREMPGWSMTFDQRTRRAAVMTGPGQRM